MPKKNDNDGSFAEYFTASIIYSIEGLFKLSFLGDKFKAVDFYITHEHNGIIYPALIQVKSTITKVNKNKNIKIKLVKDNLNLISAYHLPTFAVIIAKNSIDPFQSKAYIEAIKGVYTNSKSSFNAINELNEQNLLILKDEIVDYWNSSNMTNHKSNFKSLF